jgi:hypothetical protein
MRELLSRFFGDQFPYLIPLGIIFIGMIIFLPQGITWDCNTRTTFWAIPIASNSD